MQMNYGEIVIQLQVDKVLLIVVNFFEYVNSGFYEGMVFYCVVENFMIQGGGFMEDLRKKLVGELVKNEVMNGLFNVCGIIVMVCMCDLYSVMVQFFINYGENGDFFDQGNIGGDGWGYVVFGYVIEGMDVVDEIVMVKIGKCIEILGMFVFVEIVMIQKVLVWEQLVCELIVRGLVLQVVLQMFECFGCDVCVVGEFFLLDL